MKPNGKNGQDEPAASIAMFTWQLTTILR